MDNKRNYIMDCVKICAMLFIVLGHILIYRENGLIIASKGGAPIKCNLDFISVVLLGFCIIGTNIFFLISGYFGIEKNNKKIVQILILIYIYGFIIETILLLTKKINFKIFVTNLFFLVDRYWFLEVYLTLCLIAPFLNMLLQKMSYKQKKLFVIWGALILCVYTYAHQCTRIGIFNGFSIIWASYLYIIGTIIKTTSINKKFYILVGYFGCTFFYILIGIVLLMINNTKFFWKFCISYNNPFVFGASIFFFLFCCAIKIDFSKTTSIIINFFAKSTLGVYILHCAPDLDLFSYINFGKLDTWSNVILFIIYIFLISVIIYIVCSFIDCVRKKLLNNVIEFWVIKIVNLIEIVNEYICKF